MNKVTQEERINILNILERLGAETDCGDCMFYDECASKAECIYDMAHDLLENDTAPVVHGHQITVEKCGHAEKHNSKCLGYQKSEWNDEPSEQCVHCEFYEGLEGPWAECQD